MTDLQRLQDSTRIARGPLVAGEPIGQTHKSVVNYRYPQADDQGRLLALRSGFQYRPALVVVDPAGGKDQVLTYVGIQREPYVDVRGNLAVWMENRQHPRYTNLQFSDIILYELNSGRKRQLTEKGKYFAPALSPDRKEIVAVRHDPLAGDPVLVILDTQSGAVTEEYPIQANAILQPRFSQDGRAVFFLHKNYQGIEIRQLDRNTRKMRAVRLRNKNNIDQLRVAPGGSLTFSSGTDGVDNVYRYTIGDLHIGRLRQLTSESIGALHPRITDGGTLYYVSPTSHGLRLRQIVPADGSPEGLPPGLEYAHPAWPSFFERPAAYAEEVVDLPATVEARDYPTSDVSNTLFGYKLHS